MALVMQDMALRGKEITAVQTQEVDVAAQSNGGARETGEAGLPANLLQSNNILVEREVVVLD